MYEYVSPTLCSLEDAKYCKIVILFWPDKILSKQSSVCAGGWVLFYYLSSWFGPRWSIYFHYGSPTMEEQKKPFEM